MPKRKNDNPVISPWSRPGVTEDAIRMLREGLSHTQIASILNTTHHTSFSLGVKREWLKPTRQDIAGGDIEWCLA